MLTIFLILGWAFALSVLWGITDTRRRKRGSAERTAFWMALAEREKRIQSAARERDLLLKMLADESNFWGTAAPDGEPWKGKLYRSVRAERVIP